MSKYVDLEPVLIIDNDVPEYSLHFSANLNKINGHNRLNLPWYFEIATEIHKLCSEFITQFLFLLYRLCKCSEIITRDCMKRYIT